MYTSVYGGRATEDVTGAGTLASAEELKGSTAENGAEGTGDKTAWEKGGEGGSGTLESGTEIPGGNTVQPAHTGGQSST